jgi:acyl dehydratase
VAGIEQRKPGAFQITRLDTFDAGGNMVSTSWNGTLYRNVAVAGVDRPAADMPPRLQGTATESIARAEVRLPISALAAHVYTECARIWNPIHTDITIAAGAGLPGLILHGTATLALAISQIVTREANDDPACVRRISGRFNAMVLMPSEITVRILSRQPSVEGDVVYFEVWNVEGAPAVRDGRVVLRA